MDPPPDNLQASFLETFSDHRCVQSRINFIFRLSGPERGTRNSKATLCKEGGSILTEGEWKDVFEDRWCGGEGSHANEMLIQIRYCRRAGG